MSNFEFSFELNSSYLFCSKCSQLGIFYNKWKGILKNVFFDKFCSCLFAFRRGMLKLHRHVKANCLMKSSGFVRFLFWISLHFFLYCFKSNINFDSFAWSLLFYWRKIINEPTVSLYCFQTFFIQHSTIAHSDEISLHHWHCIIVYIIVYSIK